MSIEAGPGVATSGLVFEYDVGNNRSFVGPPIQNRATGIVGQAGSSTGWAVTTGNETSYIPSLGLTPSVYVNIWNDYPGGTGSYALAPFAFGNATVSGSTLYTYAIVYKADSGYNHANYLYCYEYNSAPTLLTQYGVFNSTNRVHLGGGWYWAWGTFTTQATAATAQIYFYQYRYGTVVEKTSVAKVLLVAGDYTGLHPMYWPAVSTTRSATASLLDLANANTIDVTNAAWSSSGTPTFNGSSNYIIAPENSTFNTQTPSIEVWAKPTATSQNGFWFEKGTVNTQYALFQEGANFKLRMYVGGSSSDCSAVSATYLSTTKYNQIVGTYSTDMGRRLYVNGVQVASDATSGTIATDAHGISIGAYGGYSGAKGYYYSGSIDIVRVYNRALSATEVMQNFNAQRGRYLV